MPDLPDANINADPELQARIAEFQAAMQAMQTEMEVKRPQMEADAAAERQAEQALAPPQPDPAQLAEFEKMEAEYGLPTVQHAGAHHPGEKVHEIYEFAEKIAEEIVEHRHHRKQSTEQQWYYARGNERLGPVPQSELLKLFEKDELPLTTLVWHRPMKEWRPASETDLAKLAEAGIPPPLPGPAQPTTPPEPAKEPVCPSCGHTGKIGERFCAECGKALAS